MTTIPKRPTLFDSNVVRAAVDVLWPELVQWAKSSGEPFAEGDEVERAKSQVIAAVRSAYDDDGFRIARALERDGWEADAALVEVLEGYTHAAYRVHRDAVTAWVTESGVTGDLPAGTKVRARALQDHVGEILGGTTAESAKKEGQYLVFCAELGHVREGIETTRALEKTGMARGGVYVNFEDVQAVVSSATDESSPA